MTRSVEIPEAAVAVEAETWARAASGGMWSQYTAATRQLLIDNAKPTARAALQAALPYLVPAEPEGKRLVGHDSNGPLFVSAAPAGDDGLTSEAILESASRPVSDTGARTASPGLREALERLVTERKSNDGNDLIVFPAELSALLTDHPAAHAVSVDAAESTASTSAVPQPAEHAVCNACGWEGDAEHDMCPACGQDEVNYFTPASESAVPQPAVIEVTEEMVEAAAEEVWPQGGSLDQHRLVRRGLEAAFQYLPFADVPLSLNREAVKAAIRSVIFKEFGTFGGSVDRATDAVMALTAVSQPDRRISPAVLADTIQAMMCGTVNRDASAERSDCESTAEVIIDSLVASGLLVSVPQPAGESATKLDCGICYRDDSDPEKIVFTYLAECGNHGRY